MVKREIVDLETGEVQWIAFQPRHKHLEGFFMAMQEGFLQIAKLRLKGRTMQVLMYMMGKLDFENYIRVTQAEIARELDIKRPDVSNAVKELVNHGILLKGPKVGNSYTYILNSNFGYKGRASSKKAMDEKIAKAQAKGWQIIDGKSCGIIQET